MSKSDKIVILYLIGAVISIIGMLNGIVDIHEGRFDGLSLIGFVCYTAYTIHFIKTVIKAVI